MKNKFKILSFLVINLLSFTHSSTVFSSVYKLSILFYLEEKIVTELMMLNNSYQSDKYLQYLDLFQSRLDQLPVDNQQVSKSAHLDLVVEKLVGNPVHVYSLMYRLVTQLPDVLDEMSKLNQTADIADNIGALLASVELPTKLDLEGVTQALARIQFAYRLDPVDLAVGNIGDVKTGGQLTIGQMMEVAKSRYTGEQRMRPGIGKEYALAIEWAEGALELAKKKGKLTWVSKIEEFLTEVRNEHDRNWVSSVGHRGILPNEEFFVSSVLGGQPELFSGKHLRMLEIDFLANEPPQPNFGSGFNVHDFYALCRGDEVPHSPTVFQPLPCRLTTNNNHYFVLAPLKEEIVSVDPPIKLYHGVLTDGEINFMTDNIFTELEAATVQDRAVTDGGGKKVTNERTQSSGWMWDYEDDILYKLSKKTSFLTGLETYRPKHLLDKTVGVLIEAEAWQIGLYGPGGLYIPHWDDFDILDPQSRTPDGLWVGNRIATVMYYLSDVEGGSTAFPLVGVATKPKKGTAVFWYNKYSNGERDPRGLHGGCPTLLGVKWVSNKWIREGSQVWARPCTHTFV